MNKKHRNWMKNTQPQRLISPAGCVAVGGGSRPLSLSSGCVWGYIRLQTGLLFLCVCLSSSTPCGTWGICPGLPSKHWKRHTVKKEHEGLRESLHTHTQTHPRTNSHSHTRTRNLTLCSWAFPMDLTLVVWIHWKWLKTWYDTWWNDGKEKWTGNRELYGWISWMVLKQ